MDSDKVPGDRIENGHGQPLQLDAKVEEVTQNYCSVKKVSTTLPLEPSWEKDNAGRRVQHEALR